MKNTLLGLICGTALLVAARVDAAPAAATGNHPHSHAAKARLEKDLQRIRTYLRSSMESWKVPGLAIAIVSKDQVLMEEGFGLRSVANKLPVTADTIFAIGSQSKAFTSMGISMLVEEGKLDWDQPVSRYLPGFKLKDTFASERLTLKDLILHRWGLPEHAFMGNGTRDRGEMVGRMQYLDSNVGFRTTFQYSDLAYVVAGYVVGQVTNGTWEAFTRKRLFEPLEMVRSNFSVSESQKSDNYALPYHLGDDGAVRQVPFRNLDIPGPAGSINSTIHEMSHWLMLHVNGGRFKGRQLVSESSLQEILKPQIVLGEEITAVPPQYPERSFMSYGEGWFIETYRGFKRVQHGGGIDGFKAKISMIPERNLAIVVLTNLSGNTPLPELATLYATDVLLGLEPIDWSSRVRRNDEAEAERRAKSHVEPARVTGTQPSHALEDYEGKYENPGYGTLVIRYADGALSAKMDTVTLPLMHWHYDVFRSVVPEFGMDMLVEFHSGKDGVIDAVRVPLEPTVEDIVFSRQ